jgi:hypothetical protein
VENRLNALDIDSHYIMKGQWSQETDSLRNLVKPVATITPSGGFINMTYSSQRQVSGPQPAVGLALPSSLGSTLTVPSPTSGLAGPSTNTTSPITPGSNGVQYPWASTVLSGAATTGKSSQFIERLQNENATLRRENNVEKSAKEEAQKSLSTSKAIESKLIAENARLELLQTTNARAIERKNRKIDEQRAALEAETDRRRAAETREQQMAVELDNTHAETNRALAEALAAQKRAEANADALRDGLHRLQARYERQVQNMAKDLAALKKRQQEDRAKLLALEVSGDQRGQEIRHTDDLVERMQTLMHTYKEQQEGMFDSLEAGADEMRAAATQRQQSGDRLLSEMTAARDKMRWVVGVDAARKS